MFCLHSAKERTAALRRYGLKKPIRLLSLTMGLSTFFLASGASTITFNSSLPAGLTPNPSFSEGAAVVASAQITNQFANLGIVLTTAGGAPYAALVDLGAGHAVSGTNGIGAVSSAGNLDYALDLDIFLVVPGANTPAATDYISIQGDEIPSGGQVYFTAYDTSGNLVASGQATDTAGGTYSLSAAGIHEFRLHSQNDDIAYDNLSFDTPGPCDFQCSRTRDLRDERICGSGPSVLAQVPASV